MPRKRRPQPPVDPTPTAGEAAVLRQDADNVYLDCSGFNQAMINCQINSDAIPPNTSTTGCGVALYSTDTDGDGNLTFHVAKADWWLPNLPREITATAWDTDDTQHVAAAPITVT